MTKLLKTIIPVCVQMLMRSRRRRWIFCCETVIGSLSYLIMRSKSTQEDDVQASTPEDLSARWKDLLRQLIWIGFGRRFGSMERGPLIFLLKVWLAYKMDNEKLLPKKLQTRESGLDLEEDFYVSRSKGIMGLKSKRTFVEARSLQRDFYATYKPFQVTPSDEDAL